MALYVNTKEDLADEIIETESDEVVEAATNVTLEPEEEEEETEEEEEEAEDDEEDDNDEGSMIEDLPETRVEITDIAAVRQKKTLARIYGQRFVF